MKKFSPSGAVLERKDRLIVDAGETAPKGASGEPWICLQGIQPGYRFQKPTVMVR